jgi:hypothetical protein
MSMSDDYIDPYENYKRLISTVQFLQTGATPHPKFYDIHIEYINKYVEVLIETPEVNQSAMIDLQICIKQYECFEQFDLTIYLSACNKLLGNISELELQKMMDTMSL